MLGQPQQQGDQRRVGVSRSWRGASARRTPPSGSRVSRATGSGLRVGQVLARVSTRTGKRSTRQRSGRGLSLLRCWGRESARDGQALSRALEALGGYSRASLRALARARRDSVQLLGKALSALALRKAGERSRPALRRSAECSGLGLRLLQIGRVLAREFREHWPGLSTRQRGSSGAPPALALLEAGRSRAGCLRLSAECSGLVFRLLRVGPGTRARVPRALARAQRGSVQLRSSGGGARQVPVERRADAAQLGERSFEV